jgi:hypothetical protein
MARWPPPTVSDYYRAAVEDLKSKVESTPDDAVLGMDLDQWIDYLVETHAMEPIQIDESRTPAMVEEEVEYTLRGYDIYTDRAPGTRVKETRVRVDVPVVPSETLQEIWKHELAPNSFSMVTYPEYQYDHRRGVIHTTVGAEPSAVKGAIEAINGAIQRYNSSIESENQSIRNSIRPIAHSKRQRVEEKHSKLDSLAAATGIPLTKKTDPTKVVPTVPKIRPKIAPVMPPVAKRQERPVLEADKFAGVLELVDNQCRGFERTPQSYSVLSEEGLRDIILGSLNAVFEGAASGETFQAIGKVDIHLRISQGEVFVAELKFWHGPKSLHETIGQLLGRLTWRDSYGVAIIFSRNAGFTGVLDAIRNEIPNVKGFAKSTLHGVAGNHFRARFSIPSDEARQAEIHVIAYNLYVQESGKRQTRPSKT